MTHTLAAVRYPTLHAGESRSIRPRPQGTGHAGTGAHTRLVAGKDVDYNTDITVEPMRIIDTLSGYI